MNNWIILDSGSTVNQFSNPNIVQNIKEVDEEINPSTNAGVKINNQKAEVPQNLEVYYDKEEITNILPLKDMIKKHQVKFDSNEEDVFKILLQNKTIK